MLKNFSNFCNNFNFFKEILKVNKKYVLSDKFEVTNLARCLLYKVGIICLEIVLL